MLSSLTGKVSELEKQTKDNCYLLEKLEVLIDVCDEERPSGELVSLPNRHTDQLAKIKLILLQQCAKTKETDFKLNRVFETLRKHERLIAELRYNVCDQYTNDIDDFDYNGISVDDTGTEDHFIYNPMACEFTPRYAGGTDRKESDMFVQRPRKSDIDRNAVDHRATEESLGDHKAIDESLGVDHKAIDESLGVDHKAIDEFDCCLTPRNNANLNLEPLEINSEIGQSEVEKCRLKFSNIPEELMYYKTRVVKLEAEINKKDDMLQIMANENRCPEKSYSQKNEWFEHKMRLLKQDKRRRGETIGKLLKCIDDMKDQGRIDETRVSEGKYVLQATLNTRDWSPEERIKAAVQALEAERVSMKIQYEAERAAGVHEESTDPVVP